MSQPRNWRLILDELNAQNAGSNDSLELGDSWREMPRRTEGVVNKTNGLYRRSALPAQPMKDYNFIIKQQPTGVKKTTIDSAPVCEEVPLPEPPKLVTPDARPITPENNENSEISDFSQFLTAQNDGMKAATSTPYPVRQNNANESPTRTVNVQRSATDSPKKLFVPAPTRIPVSTPRSSRALSVEPRSKQPSDRNKISSPTSLVSSTVNIVGDDEESEPVKSLGERPTVRDDLLLPVTKSAPDQNCLPLDEDQQEQDAGTKNSEVTLFRRPTVVPRPLKQKDKLEPDDDQSKISNSTYVSQRSKKSKSKIDPLLESYMKVGESIANKTNSIPIENLSSASRRKLYKKGDSRNENDLLNDGKAVEQPSFVLNPVAVASNRTFIKVKSISDQSSAVEGDVQPENNAQVETSIQGAKETEETPAVVEENVASPRSGTGQNNLEYLTSDNESDNESKVSDDREEDTNSQNQNARSNPNPNGNEDEQESISDEQSQNTPSNGSPSDDDVQNDGATSNGKQIVDKEKDLPTANSNDQQNDMSAKHSKQVLEEILGDWSDAVQPQEHVDRSESGDSEEEVSRSKKVQPRIAKQLPTKSTVRQVRSQSKKGRSTGTTSSKTGRRGAVRTNLQQIDEDEETEEDELSTTSVTIRNQMKNASVAKKAQKQTRAKGVSTKSKNEPVHSTQQEVSENDVNLDSDEEMAVEPSISELPRASGHETDVSESETQPPNKSRSKNDNIETGGSAVELPTKSRRKAGKQRVDDKEPATNGRETDSKGTGKERKTRDEDDAIETDGRIESVVVAKSQGRQTRKNRLNAEDDVTEADNKKTKVATTSKGKKTNSDGMRANEIEPELATSSRDKKRKMRPTVEDDELDEVETEAELATTSKDKKGNKRPNLEDDELEDVESEVELVTTSKDKRRNKRPNLEDILEENETEAELATTSKGKKRRGRPVAGKDVNNASESETELATTSNSKDQQKRSTAEEDRRSKNQNKKKRSNAEDDVTGTNGNEVAPSKKSQTKSRKKRVDAEEVDADDAELVEHNEPQIGDSPSGDNTVIETQSVAKPKGRNSQKRKHQSIAEAKNLSDEQVGNSSSKVDGSMARKRRKLSKWERHAECFLKFGKLKATGDGNLATGTRHSSRERRLPSTNLIISIPNIPRSAASNRSTSNGSTSNRTALQRQNGRLTKTANSESQNVFSMLLNGSMDKEPPLITNLDGIEITQGFHRTVKNKLIIHHIPGETGPSYGYFTLEPGMVKRACRISWNLHIHVVSGPIQIISNDKSEQMATGSFASLHSGTKYSLRNDGENSALVFFSQQANE